MDELTSMHLRNDLSKNQFEDITSTFNASVFESLGINVSIKQQTISVHVLGPTKFLQFPPPLQWKYLGPMPTLARNNFGPLHFGFECLRQYQNFDIYITRTGGQEGDSWDLSRPSFCSYLNLFQSWKIIPTIQECPNQLLNHSARGGGTNWDDWDTSLDFLEILVLLIAMFNEVP